MASGLQGFHPGEVAIQRKLDYAGPMRGSYSWIAPYMDDQQRTFHSHNLPFLPLTTLDSEGRPWSSILAGADGRPGFIRSPNETTLDMEVKVWDGDPFRHHGQDLKGLLAAGIGIEISTRRRNKFAGRIERGEVSGNTYRLRLRVNQAIGNCPKYINVRDLIPHVNTEPHVVYQQPHLQEGDRLPDELIDLVNTSDTVFLGSSWKPSEREANKFPPHVGMNHRGGNPGFIRVRPVDGRTLVLPDYSGNRLMTSLGNIEATQLASMTFIDFKTGDILYLTGKARNVVGPESQALMPLQNVVTTLLVTGYVFVRSAFPLRERAGTQPRRSPYSPPVRFLAEESKVELFDDGVRATLRSIALLTPTLGVFTFTTSRPVHILPGQSAILNFAELLGAPTYAHMAPARPASVNDDRTRTWTVSSAHHAPTSTFALTMREKEGGTVTGALFAIARKLAGTRPELLGDTRPLELATRLVGIAGEFVLPERAEGASHRLLWVAGGIGVTPFLSMLAWLADAPASGDDIVLALATREPEVLVPLILDAVGPNDAAGRRIAVDVFSTEEVSEELLAPSRGSVTVRMHKGRIPATYFSGVDGLDDREVFVCGPPDFEKTVFDLLADAGVARGRVHREGFAY